MAHRESRLRRHLYEGAGQWPRWDLQVLFPFRAVPAGLPEISSNGAPPPTCHVSSWIWISKDLIPASRREHLMHSCTDPHMELTEWTPG